MKKEYDFTNAEQGKFYIPIEEIEAPIYLDKDVSLFFADKLKGNLLLVHGSGDDNVHFQGSERLINALVKANKIFSFMEYPNRSHGIYEGENTTRHVYTLLTWYLTKNLPPGAR